MESLWNDDEAAKYQGDLAKRVYTSRLLGRDKSLVLHGGGNTSVKITEKDIFSEPVDLLYVKGSGWDLEFIEQAGFSPVRLEHLQKLATLESLSDLDMVNELRCNMLQASAPTPSVEAILHATLPYKYVDHTHADAVVTITNTENGLERVQEVFGDSVVIIPYVMPGFDLARLCAEQFAAQANENTIGMVLMNHGIFSFGESAQESYERMIALVTRAENYLLTHQAWTIENTGAGADSAAKREQVAALRQQVSIARGQPVIMRVQSDQATQTFLAHEDLAGITQQGPATPDHVIRTKRVPLLGRDVDRYVEQYREYFAEQGATGDYTMLDPAPRMILDQELGLCSIGDSAAAAAIVQDIYNHTMTIIQRATLLGGYRALPASDIFAVEYWELEQAKLKKGGSRAEFGGEVALVTGAASGIGQACVESLLARGAAVIGLDINESIVSMYQREDFLGIVCDVTERQQVASALEQGVSRFGGLDMLIVNAGVFPGGCNIAELDLDEWRRVMNINLDASLMLMQLAYPLLRCAPEHGRVVVVGSKNVPAPGIGAASYSASKAALNQLVRIAAMEWGVDGIRVNTVHPDAVFDTGLWTDEVLAARAEHYGMTVDEYKSRNILKTQVSSADVAELVAAMCGSLFQCTTAAQVPIDGGNERVI